jgi:S-adenosylmethionine hydrolase
LIITLTTDFGLSDHFVGAMKGVILDILPEATIVDISHELTAFEVGEAAFIVSQTYPCFPKKTVHVVVVDPGVGTSRRPVLLEAAGQYFVGPDNGVFSIVTDHEKHKVREITATRYFRQPVSYTFHGRDIFAPVAAHLAGGVPPGRFGKPIDNYLRRQFETPQRSGKRTWTGTVLKIDRFGNLITNFRADQFPAVRERPFELWVGFEKIRRLVLNYAEGGFGEVFLIEGSAGFLEVASNQGSAAKLLGVGVGAPAELTLY